MRRNTGNTREYVRIRGNVRGYEVSGDYEEVRWDTREYRGIPGNTGECQGIPVTTVGYQATRGNAREDGGIPDKTREYEAI